MRTLVMALNSPALIACSIWPRRSADMFTEEGATANKPSRLSVWPITREVGMANASESISMVLAERNCAGSTMCSNNLLERRRCLVKMQHRVSPQYGGHSGADSCPAASHTVEGKPLIIVPVLK